MDINESKCINLCKFMRGIWSDLVQKIEAELKLMSSGEFMGQSHENTRFDSS